MMPARSTGFTLLRPPMRLIALFVASLLLAACSPKNDWREFHASNAPYVIAFPAKAQSETRDVPLGGQTVAMTMSSTQVDGVTFAVASASLPDTPGAQNALILMKQALLANIQAKVIKESPAQVARQDGLQIEAVGNPNLHGKPQEVLLHARLLAADKRVYQLVIMGPSERITRDTIDTFFTSFKLE